MSEDFATKYPQLAKSKAVNEKSQTIGEFVDWLLIDKGYRICTFIENESPAGGQYFSEHMGTARMEQLLAEYFEIDLEAAEQERRAMLADFVERTA